MSELNVSNSGGADIRIGREDLQAKVADLEAEVARLQARVKNQEPWMSALGRMLVEYRIVRFPDDVLAWRDERDRYKALAQTAEQVVKILRGSLNLGVVQVPPPIQDADRLYALKDAIKAYDAILRGSKEGE
ncbi:hypothetical protein LCGC14_2282640 [marine sediment metagenome]|uniref:Uncharacterized protein n=1 Tax=marine sediment metagenome TaxID=412755 RepID=A0A0F9FNW9_9ZZZZ